MNTYTSTTEVATAETKPVARDTGTINEVDLVILVEGDMAFAVDAEGRCDSSVRAIFAT